MAPDALAAVDPLEEQLARLRAETSELRARYWAAERRQATLLNSYVALLRLHASTDRSELLLALQEVLASLVGCEQAALFLRDGARLRPHAVFGASVEPAAEVELGEGRVGRAASSGVLDAPVDADASDGISACVPLLLRGETIGVLVLYGLLSQKAALQPADIELLDLLSTHVAIALRASASGPDTGTRA